MIPEDLALFDTESIQARPILRIPPQDCYYLVIDTLSATHTRDDDEDTTGNDSGE